MRHLRNVELVVIIAAFLCSCTPKTPPSGIPKPAAQNPHLDQCVMLAESGDYKAALPECTSAASFAPRDFTAQAYLGKVRAELGDITGAISAYEAAIDIDPQSIKVRMELGDLLLSQNKTDAAVAQFSAVEKIKPDFLEAVLKLARSYSQNGDWTAADEYYSKGIQIAADREDLHIMRIESLARAGQIQRAMTACSAAHSLFPQSTSIRALKSELKYDEALAAYQTGQHDLAMTRLTDLLAQDPRLSKALILKGRIYREKGDVDHAIGMFRKAIELNPRDGIAYVHLGNACRMKGDKDQAIEAYRQALRINPDDADAKANLKQLIGAPRKSLD